MITITDSIAIDESLVTYKAVRSSGPGGQHVNKVATAIVLQYSVVGMDYPDSFLHQLKSNAGSKFSKDGTITIKAQSYRSQTRNKVESFKRLVRLFELSSIRAKQRKMTTPTKGALEKRLSNKRKKSEKKILRKPPSLDD